MRWKEDLGYNFSRDPCWVKNGQYLGDCGGHTHQDMWQNAQKIIYTQINQNN